MEQTKKHPEGIRPRLAGVLILAAFILYGGGEALISNDQAGLGLTLVLINSLAVFAIGILFRPIIAKDNPRTGNIYLVTRIVEGLFLGASGLVLALQNNADLSDTLYQTGMIALGLGSISFCYWLLVTKRMPNWLAGLGLIGYPLLVVGMVLAFASMDTLSMFFLVPGAIFEIVGGLFLVFIGIHLSSSQNTEAVYT
jgi:peptidoglycan/LPS O-acetylase OafA/YrhL